MAAYARDRRLEGLALGLPGKSYNLMAGLQHKKAHEAFQQIYSDFGRGGFTAAFRLPICISRDYYLWTRGKNSRP